MLADDDVDMLIKGHINRILPEDERRIDNEELKWIEFLESKNVFLTTIIYNDDTSMSNKNLLIGSDKISLYYKIDNNNLVDRQINLKKQLDSTVNTKNGNLEDSAGYSYSTPLIKEIIYEKYEKSFELKFYRYIYHNDNQIYSNKFHNCIRIHLL